MELLKEKLLVTEKRHQEVTKQLNEIETERLAANARAVSAEQIQQNLRDQINEDRRARESVLPFLLGNQLVRVGQLPIQFRTPKRPNFYKYSSS